MPAEAEEVVADPVPQPALNKRKERSADPGPEMPGIPVRGILEPAGKGKLLFRKWQERAHQTRARLRANAGETRRSAAPQHPKQNRLHLVIGMVCGDDVAGVYPSLRFAEPGVACFARLGFGCIRAKVQFPQLEWEPELSGLPTHPLPHFPTSRLNTVVDVRHDQVQPESRPGLME